MYPLFELPVLVKTGSMKSYWDRDFLYLCVKTLCQIFFTYFKKLIFLKKYSIDFKKSSAEKVCARNSWNIFLDFFHFLGSQIWYFGFNVRKKFVGSSLALAVLPNFFTQKVMALRKIKVSSFCCFSNFFLTFIEKYLRQIWIFSLIV